MKIPPMRFGSRGKLRAFSLLELLTVIAISLILLVASGPSISAISGAGSVNKAASDLSLLLELARAQAMSRGTYLRVAIASVAPGAAMPEGGLVILPVFSPDGTLSLNTGADMADPGKWPTLTRPLVLKDFQIRDVLNVAMPDTSEDALPSSSNIDAFQRFVPGLGEVNFTGFIQFSPNGQSGVLSDAPARHIKIAVDKKGAQQGRNPAVLRLSGANGSVRIFRRDDQTTIQ